MTAYSRVDTNKKVGGRYFAPIAIDTSNTARTKKGARHEHEHEHEHE